MVKAEGAAGFAERFSELLRTEKDVHAFAEMIGVSEAALYHYAAGRRQPNLAKLVAICKALRVSADRLLGLPEKAIDHRLLVKLVHQAEKQEAQARELREIVHKQAGAAAPEIITHYRQRAKRSNGSS